MGARIPELPKIVERPATVCSYCRRPFEGDATCRGCGAVCKVTMEPTRPPLPPPIKAENAAHSTGPKAGEQ